MESRAKALGHALPTAMIVLPLVTAVVLDTRSLQPAQLSHGRTA